MNSRCLSLLVGWLCLVCGHVDAVDRVIDPLVMEELRTQAVPAWQAAEREFRSIDVTYTVSNKEGPRDKLKLFSKQTFQFAYDADRQVRLLRTQKDGVFGKDHDAANARYEFDVWAPDINARGTLTRVQLLSSAAMNNRQPDGEVSNLNFALCRLQAECRMNRMPLVKLVDPMQFETVEAVKFDESGHSLIRYSAKFVGQEDRFLKRGRTYTATFDPAQRYRSVAWRIDISDDSYDEFRTSYHERDDVRTPREIVYTAEHGSQFSEQIWTYELPKPCTIPDAEFYLPHYGFSESVLETLGPNPWRIRLILINVGILTIVIGAWLLRRRAAKAHERSSP